jgi:hypothetical protein
MPAQEPHPSEERLQQIQEALEQMPDLSDLELVSSDLAFKIEEGQEDVARLRDEVAEVKDKIDDLQSEDR